MVCLPNNCNLRPIHPLDVPFDQLEVKRPIEGNIKMTTAVRISLLFLRVYMILMGLLVIYHVLTLAGIFH
jgi:hypothetical protein